MLTQQQHIDRMGRVGASDVPIVLGLCKYKSAYELWAEKTGRITDKRSNKDPECAAVGHLLEPYLLDAAQEDLGVVGMRGTEVFSADGLIVATLDGAVLSSQEPVEIKTQGLFGPVYDDWGHEFTNQVPQRFYWQLQTQMVVMGSEVGHLYALLGGRGKVRYTVDRDQQAENVIENVREWFVKHVSFDEEPPRTADAAPVLRRMTPITKQTVALDERFAELEVEYKDLNASTKKNDKRKEEIQNEFILTMGLAEYGVLPDLRVVSFRQITAKGYEVGPKTYRKLLFPR